MRAKILFAVVFCGLIFSNAYAGEFFEGNFYTVPEGDTGSAPKQPWHLRANNGTDPDTGEQQWEFRIYPVVNGVPSIIADSILVVKNICRGDLRLLHFVAEQRTKYDGGEFKTVALTYNKNRKGRRNVLMGSAEYRDGTRHIIRGQTRTHHPRFPRPDLPQCSELPGDDDQD